MSVGIIGVGLIGHGIARNSLWCDGAAHMVLLEPRWEPNFSTHQGVASPFHLLWPRFLSVPQVSINQHGKQ
jgi:hypothetical protein